MREFKLLSVIIGITILLTNFQNCSSHEEAELYFESYASLAGKVLEDKCTSCHSPSSGVNSAIPDILDFPTLEAQQIDGRSVLVMGEPQNSLLYQSMIDLLPPHDTLSITNSDKDSIANWILGTPTGGVDQVFFFQVNEIISSKCLGCHSNQNPQMSSYTQIKSLVTVGDPMNSQLYKTIIDPTAGERMGTTAIQLLP